MSTSTRRPHTTGTYARTFARSAVVAAIAVALAVGAFSGTASAAERPAAPTGTADRATALIDAHQWSEPALFAAQWNFASGREVVRHVERVDDGFFVAVDEGRAVASAGSRTFTWYWQPDTIGCLDADYTVQFNAHLGMPVCQPDFEALAARGITSPAGHAADLAACRSAADATPWSRPAYGDGFSSAPTGCDPSEAVSAFSTRLALAPSQGVQCAPWEDQSPAVAPRMGLACQYQSYPWASTGDLGATFYTAPDACTGMPADTFKGTARYDASIEMDPNAPDSCDGTALSPSCAAGDEARKIACGATTTLTPGAGSYDVPTSEPGVPGGPTEPENPGPGQPTYDATRVVEATASHSALASATKSATAQVKRGVVKVKVTKRIKGRLVRAKGIAPILVKRRAQASASAEATVTESAVVAESCRAASVEAAEACAQARAEQAAAEAAAIKATQKATQAAQREAGQEASAAAKAAATQAARAAEVSAAERRAAHRAAVRQAMKKIRALR